MNDNSYRRQSPRSTPFRLDRAHAPSISALFFLRYPYADSAGSIGVTGSISSQKKLPQKYTAAET